MQEHDASTTRATGERRASVLYRAILAVSDENIADLYGACKISLIQADMHAYSSRPDARFKMMSADISAA